MDKWGKEVKTLVKPIQRETDYKKQGVNSHQVI